MNRRDVILGAGALAGAGLAGLARRGPPAVLDVKIWTTAAAAGHRESPERAAGYVERALEAAGVAVRIDHGESPVAVSSDDHRRLERVTWPRLVLQGAAGLAAIDPVRDVNVLLTDGPVTGRTAGYAVSNVATVPGARRLAELPPADQVDEVLDYGVTSAVGQLLLHEVGHALGLDHDHGSVLLEDDTVTATPMIGGYAWSDAAQEGSAGALGADACHHVSVPLRDGRRLLSMRFSPCAAGAIRRYRGGLLP